MALPPKVVLHRYRHSDMVHGHVNDSARSLLPRSVALLVFWLILDGAKPAGLLIGLPAAALAIWLAARLMPPLQARISVAPLFRFCGHFL
jgi:hypothetical protein